MNPLCLQCGMDYVIPGEDICRACIGEKCYAGEIVYDSEGGLLRWYVMAMYDRDEYPARRGPFLSEAAAVAEWRSLREWARMTTLEGLPVIISVETYCATTDDDHSPYHFQWEYR